MSYKLGGVTWNDDGTMATDGITSLEALDKILHYIEKQYGEKVEKLVFTKSDKVFEIDTLRKELKALEIIKEKKVKIEWYCGDVFLTPQTALTDDEYDLLKEVLNEDEL